ncbi:Cyanovirin-N [Aspergillus coremiiformis]|uniref:Cyanovirin-N n=1 Tax=Aspergillus coremiiformis TaxID=138285 RepID=A0A5N6Z7G3_9EURO|nr:Cyanovirin-N [Aspergillus coremiiformis]
MSFHHSCRNIFIQPEHGQTILLADVRDTHGNYHHRKIRLDDHIGNTDGWFLWGGSNFTRSARNVALENTPWGPKLCADLPMINGGLRGRQGMMLSDKIQNVDGRLKFSVVLPKTIFLPNCERH